eukprot:763189-Pyramimonas_sp.AAC.1
MREPGDDTPHGICQPRAGMRQPEANPLLGGPLGPDPLLGWPAGADPPPGPGADQDVRPSSA